MKSTNEYNEQLTNLLSMFLQLNVITLNKMIELCVEIDRKNKS